MWAAIVAAVATIAVVGAAGAQDYPDLRGTWVGETKAVFVNTGQYYIEGKAAVSFDTSPIVVVIDQQQGRRFSGTVEVENWTKPIVGALTAEDMIRWAEPGGTVEGHLLDSDTLDHCYFRGAEFMQMAACGELKRQK